MKISDNQKIFAIVTGYESTDFAISDTQNYNYNPQNEGDIMLIVVRAIANADLVGLEISSSNLNIDKIVEAIYNYHQCETGESIDIEKIYNSLA